MGGYTKQDCISALQRAAKQVGESPTVAQYRTTGESPSYQTIRRTFEDWDKAKSAAGLDTYQPTKEDCIGGILRAAGEIGHSPSIHEYKETGTLPSVTTIQRRLGTWNEAKEIAGVETVLSNRDTEYSGQDCIDSLRAVASELGHSPSRKEYQELSSSPGTTYIESEFGTWNRAKEAAGLEAHISPREVSYSWGDCIRAIRDAEKTIGHPPSLAEFRRLDTTPSLGPIREIFGTFNNAKRFAGVETTAKGDNSLGVDTGYFENIDTDQKAYWAGFLYADGCMYEDPRGVLQCRVGLKRTDRSHIVKFKEDINSEHTIHDGSQVSFGSENEYSAISISNPVFCQHLVRHGFRPRPQAREYPQLDKDLIPAFIRGYFDGDGSIYRSSSWEWKIVFKEKSNADIFQRWLSCITDEYTSVREQPLRRPGAVRLYTLNGYSKRFLRDVYETIWGSDYTSIRCLERKGVRMNRSVST